MHILIVGNMGYIGPVVASHFRRMLPNVYLTGFDAGYFAGCLMNPQVFPESTMDRQYFGDVRRFPREILRGVDVVIQLAAISNDPMGQVFQSATEQVNSDCAVRIAIMAKEEGVTSFVFASSCSVYGSGGDDAKTEESDPNPLTAYAHSKISAEEGLGRIANSGFRVTCLRFATACGWSPRLRLDLVLNDFVASAIASQRITILSDGTPWRPLIHVKDMARIVEWAAWRDTSNGGPFAVLNAGSDAWNYRVRELADAVASAVGGVEVSVNSEAAPDKRSYRVSFAKLNTMAPQHRPIVSLAAAVGDLANELTAIGFKDQDFRNSDFIRLKVLSEGRASGRLDEDLFPTGYFSNYRNHVTESK